MGKQLVFIRHAGSCGSNALRMQLDLHPQIAFVGRLRLPEELLDWAQAKLPKLDPYIDQQVIDASCRGFFEQYCAMDSFAERVLVHKRSMRADRLADLLRVWPEAKLIYMIRHPVGNVESYINTNLSDEFQRHQFKATVYNSMLRWHAELDAYVRSGIRDDPRVLEVRFEDFVHRPGEQMARIYEFIGVEPEDRPLVKDWNTYEDRFVLNMPERQWIDQAASALSRELGYGDQACSVPQQWEHLITRHQDRRLAEMPPLADATRMIGDEIADRPESTIGLYPAGSVARLLAGRVNREHAGEVLLFDDNPDLHGTRIDGVSVHPLSVAASLGVDRALVLSFVNATSAMDRWAALVPQVPCVDPFAANPGSGV